MTYRLIITVFSVLQYLIVQYEYTFDSVSTKKMYEHGICLPLPEN